MNFKKLTAVVAVVLAMSVFSVPTAMAQDDKKPASKAETKTTDPITGLFTGVAGILDGLLGAIGGLFTGGK
jgi:uncharacterized membrane protein YfcA